MKLLIKDRGFRSQIFGKLILLGLLVIFTNTVIGATNTVGPEASVTLPTSANYHLDIGTQPDENIVQNLNPPVFSWLYYENPALLAYPYQAMRTFRFQLSPNPNFTTLTWDIACSNNFYNYVPPITNADGSTYTGPNYWRVIYMDSNGNVISNSVAHVFTMAGNARKWDRSMLGNNNYLIGIGSQHPHILFNQANRDAMSTFLQTTAWPTPGTYFNSITNTALSCLVQPWWNNQSVFTNINHWEQYASVLAQVGFTYQLTTNQAILAANPGRMLEIYATNLMQFGYDRFPGYNLNANVPQYLAECYDWLYSTMTPTQRANVLAVMESMAQFYVFEDDWYYTSAAPNTNRVYTNALFCPYSSSAKVGESHTRNDQVGLSLTMAGMGESAILRNMQSYFLNYYIAQFDPFQGDDGRPYNSVQDFAVDRQFGPYLTAAVVFPEAALTNAPIYNSLLNLFAYLDPVGYRNSQTEQWGVRGSADAVYLSQWGWTRMWAAGVLLQSGPAMRQYNRSKTMVGTTPEGPLLGPVFLPFYSPPPAETDWPNNYLLDVVRGWAMSISHPPSDWNSFTNGVGFIFQARPSAAGRMNGTYTDGQIQMWAYGAHVTAGGSGNYEEHCLFHNGLFVDGIGLNNPNPALSDACYARFTQFTNTVDYTVVSADLTKAFARTNWYTTGYEDIETAFYSYATNARPYISSINRSVLFPHKKYLVIYDQLQTTQPAHFQWKWNIWRPGAIVDTNGCAFNYTATNVYNGSNVTVYVAHVVDPTLMSLTNMTTGQNLTGLDLNNTAKMNPYTGENYNGSKDPYGPVDAQHYWASTIWIQNKTATNNWHFMSVVFPVKWGQTAPTITRVDDYTVHVQQGADDDVISVNPSTSPPTFTLNLTGPSLAPSRLSPPSDLRVSP